MTEHELSQEFSKLYKTLYIYANKARISLKSPIETPEILSECYLHLHKNLNKISTPSQVESFSKNWIKMNLYWTESPMHRMYKKQSSTQLTVTSYDTVDFAHIAHIETTFKNSLNQLETRLWHIYYEKDITTAKQIASHLGISISSGYNILNECKLLLNKFKQHLHENV